MKLFASLLLLSVSALAQSKTPVAGTWQGNATVKGHQVPITLKITGTASNLTAALLNGPESSPATSATLTGNHLLLVFNYYARTLDATLENDTLTGTFGTATNNFPISLSPAKAHISPKSPGPHDVEGDWEIAVHSTKGESAWQLHVDKIPGNTIKAVIQRIDGDTGSLYGDDHAENDTAEYTVSHLTAAGPALYSFKHQQDGTLLVSNLLNDKQTDLVARRPAEARKENLPTPTDPTQQTSIKDPAAPFRFSFPDLSGKLVSNTDPQFEGKVVIVTIGGSWCPNCHDEAPFFESLYKQFHTRGLEIVNLSFEEADQLKNPTRLHAFIQRYGLTYTVLVAGEPDQLNEKITQANNLNCWPTSFFIGRDGHVKQVHAGFAGPANPVAHEELKKEVTALLEQLLAEPIPTQNASR